MMSIGSDWPSAPPETISTTAPTPRQRWARRIAVLAGIIATFAVPIAAMHFNQTYDEPAHLAAGMQWLREGTYDLDPQHPPLARILIALGPALGGARPHDQPTSWTEGNAILISGGRYAHTLMLARLGVLPFFVLLLVVTWSWTRRLYGEPAAALAVVLVATTPQLLAHAGLATTDLPLAATLVWVLAAFTRWLEQPSRRTTLLFAIAGAAAMTSKLSSIPFFGLAAVMIVLARWAVGERAATANVSTRPPLRDAARYFRPAVAAAVGAGVLVWAVYRFHLRMAKGGLIPVPAPELLEGLRALASHNSSGHSAYLLGRVSERGWWYYPWAALLVKTPLAFLALSALGIATVFATPRRRADWRTLAPLLSVAAVMIVAMWASIDIGVRHILPVYPLLAIPAAGAAVDAWSRVPRRVAARVAIGALVVWQTVQAVGAYPDFLSDFNALAGAEPDRVLVDSNLDWGQDLDRLADTLQARHIGAVTLFYFGSTPVGALRVADTVRLGGAAPATGWIAASRTYVHGVYASCFTWLQAYTPVARIGRSILLYRLLPDTVPRFPTGTAAAQRASDPYGAVLAGAPSANMICRQSRALIGGGHDAFVAPAAAPGARSPSGAAPATSSAVVRAPAVPVSNAMLLGAATDAADWLTYGRDYSNSRYSPLDQITTSSVRHLAFAWAHQIGVPVPGQESTPIVAGGVLYYTSPFGSVISLDARTGVELWRHEYKSAAVATCCGAKNRGVALYGDKLYYGTLDDHLLALDARTGQVVWDVQTADPDSSYSMTAAPLAADGKIIIGVSGSEFGIRGRLDAYDAETGKLAWRFYSVPSPEQGGWWGRWSRTTPDGDPLPRDIAREHADSSRYADAWRVGGGGIWNTPSYDPALGMIYLGVGNPAPNMDGSVRPGDNLYTTSIVALDVHTGRLRWYYQEVPHDLWDYDATSPTLLLDVTVDGRRVPAVAEAGKVGWIYILDRRTGQRIRRTAEFVPHENTFAAPTPEGVRIMPGMGGGSNWTPLSYSPRTGLLYVAGIIEPIRFVLSPEPFSVGTKWQGGRHVPLAPAQGTFTAIDAETGTVRWQTSTPDAMLGSASLVTAGDVVFYGEATGVLHAADARTGEVLWTTRLGGPVRAPVITYEVDGKQYIAIAASGTLFAFTLP